MMFMTTTKKEIQQICLLYIMFTHSFEQSVTYRSPGKNSNKYSSSLQGKHCGRIKVLIAQQALHFHSVPPLGVSKILQYSNCIKKRHSNTTSPFPRHRSSGLDIFHIFSHHTGNLKNNNQASVNKSVAS